MAAAAAVIVATDLSAAAHGQTCDEAKAIGALKERKPKKIEARKGVGVEKKNRSKKGVRER
jgi:hypothetical protein